MVLRTPEGIRGARTLDFSETLRLYGKPLKPCENERSRTLNFSEIESVRAGRAARGLTLHFSNNLTLYVNPFKTL